MSDSPTDDGARETRKRPRDPVSDKGESLAAEPLAKIPKLTESTKLLEYARERQLLGLVVFQTRLWERLSDDDAGALLVAMHKTFFGSVCAVLSDRPSLFSVMCKYDCVPCVCHTMEKSVLTPTFARACALSGTGRCGVRAMLCIAQKFPYAVLPADFVVQLAGEMVLSGEVGLLKLYVEGSGLDWSTQLCKSDVVTAYESYVVAVHHLRYLASQAEKPDALEYLLTITVKTADEISHKIADSIVDRCIESRDPRLIELAGKVGITTISTDTLNGLVAYMVERMRQSSICDLLTALAKSNLVPDDMFDIGQTIFTATKHAATEDDPNLLRVLYDYYRRNGFAVLGPDTDKIVSKWLKHHKPDMLKSFFEIYGKAVILDLASQSRYIVDAISSSAQLHMVLESLWQTCKVSGDDLRAKTCPSMDSLAYEFMRRAAACGDAELLSWLHDTVGLTEGDARPRGTTSRGRPIEEAARSGDGANALKVLSHLYKLTAGDLAEDGKSALMNAVYYNDANALVVLNRLYGVGTDMARIDDNALLRSAARRGSCQALHALHDVYNLTIEDARAHDNKALRLAARQGQSDAITVLANTFGLTPVDARAHDNKALRQAAKKGNVNVLETLKQLFGLTSEDARAHDNKALREAALNGHVDVLKILATSFKLTREDAQARDNQALRNAASHGHVDVLLGLRDLFGLSGDDARAGGNRAVYFAYINKHYNVLRVLYSGFGLTSKDFSSRFTRLAIRKRKHGDKETMKKWLASKIHMSEADAIDTVERILGNL